jgi:hypothetical protein
MNAATRIRASWRGFLVRADVVSAGVLAGAGVLVGVGQVVVGAVSEDAEPGMIPIRYVTDRFGFPEGRTG